MPLSITSDEAARMLDACITQFTASYNIPGVGGLHATMERLKEADPDFGKYHAVSIKKKFYKRFMEIMKGKRLNSPFIGLC